LLIATLSVAANKKASDPKVGRWVLYVSLVFSPENRRIPPIMSRAIPA
jgi:hypothetical protein